MRRIRKLDELDAGEFALLAVDPWTGVPLDDEGNWAETGRHRYLCFPSAEAAERHARERLHQDSQVEWVLFDSSAAQIDVFHDLDAVLRRAVHNRGRGFWRRLFGSRVGGDDA